MTYPLHEYNGQMLTIRELAALAGCNYDTLFRRMNKGGFSVAQAVEMGASNRRRKLGTGKNAHLPPKPKEVVAHFDYHGQSLRISELAAIAGTNCGAMRKRLQFMDAVLAVSMGESQLSRMGHEKRAPTASGRPRKVMALRVRKDKSLLKTKNTPSPFAEVINPANVKPTVLPGFIGNRFTFTPVPGWVGEISLMREQEQSEAMA